MSQFHYNNLFCDIVKFSFIYIYIYLRILINYMYNTNFRFILFARTGLNLKREMMNINFRYLNNVKFT